MYKVKMFACIGMMLIGYIVKGQNISINESGIQPDPSAMLDISDTARGVLIPRLSKTQRDAISAPAQGLMIFMTTDTIGFFFYNGAAWEYIHGSSNPPGTKLVDVLDAGNDAQGDTIVNLNALSIGRAEAPKASLQLDSFLVIQAEPYENTRWFGNNIYLDNTNTIRYINDGQADVYGFGNNQSILGHWGQASANAVIPSNALSSIALQDSGITLNGEAGDFSIKLSGNVKADSLRVGDNYSFPRTVGLSNQVLGVDAGGNLSFQDETDPSIQVSKGFIPTFNGSKLVASKLYQDGSSGLGIGTTTPGGMLHVNDSSANTSSLHLTNLGTGGGSTDGFKLEYNSSIGAGLLNYENTSLAFGTNASYRMYLDATGKLGIGTSTPTESIQVKGSIEVDGEYKYENVKTRYTSIPPSAFVSARPESYELDPLGVMLYLSIGGTGGTSGWAVAPLTVPNGATVTGITYVYYDNDLVLEVTCGISRISNLATTSTAYGTFSSGLLFASSNYEVQKETLSLPIDYENYYYQVYFEGARGNNFLRLKNVIVEYTVTQAD
jgi:hypothetical protein